VSEEESFSRFSTLLAVYLAFAQNWWSETAASDSVLFLMGLDNLEEVVFREEP
jgi:hypothetical protein